MSGMLRIPRSRGTFSGVLLVLLGAWGGLIAFIGPYFHYAYTPDSAWSYTSGRLWLEVLPGVGALVGGLIALASANRPAAMFGAWLAAISGAWFLGRLRPDRGHAGRRDPDPGRRADRLLHRAWRGHRVPGGAGTREAHGGGHQGRNRPGGHPAATAAHPAAPGGAAARARRRARWQRVRLPVTGPGSGTAHAGPAILATPRRRRAVFLAQVVELRGRHVPAERRACASYRRPAGELARLVVGYLPGACPAPRLRYAYGPGRSAQEEHPAAGQATSAQARAGSR